MISMAHVNETANATNMTRLENEDPVCNLDMTKMPTDMFLDGCKVGSELCDSLFSFVSLPETIHFRKHCRNVDDFNLSEVGIRKMCFNIELQLLIV